MAEAIPQSISRTAAQEEGDRAEAIESFLSEAYRDWPNEAGFDNLTEHRGPIELAVRGHIPAWAAGSLFRNGPGARRIENVKKPAGADSNSKEQRDGNGNGTLLISHWFDGLAHLHRFDIVPFTESASAPDGQQQVPVKVLYSSRRQSDEFVKIVQEQGSYGSIISFGQRADPCVGLFGKSMSCFRALGKGYEASRYDNLNVAVLPMFSKAAGLTKNTSKPNGSEAKVVDDANGSKLWITSDTAGIRVLDAATLEPSTDASGIQQQSALGRSLKGAMSCAHAQRCPKTGDIFNYNLEPGAVALYRIFRVSASTGKTDVLATIARPNLPPAYIHSFFLTERFVVLRVPVAHFGKMGLAIPWKGNLIEAIEPFDASKKCKWFFVDRLHGQGVVAEYETPAAFFFHSVNAWDEVAAPAGAQGQGDKGAEAQVANVMCDVVDFPNADIIHKNYYDILMNIDGKAKTAFTSKAQVTNAMSNLVRWKFRIPVPTLGGKKLKTSKAAPEQLFSIPSPHSGELPTINPEYHTRQHRFVYSLPAIGKSTFFTTIVKTDTITRDVKQWNNPTGHTPGEAIFVPRPGGVEEDDGVLLSVVLDGHSEKSYLICLDAKTMQEVGRADMDFAVGFGLHGVHSPNSK